MVNQVAEEEQNTVLTYDIVEFIPRWAKAHWPPPGYDPAGFLFCAYFFSRAAFLFSHFWMSSNRVSFLIDGFNLYHSVKRAEKELGGASTKWLNISDLCTSYLHLFGRDADLQDIIYFSALAKHLETKNPDVTKRHRKYLRCLEDTGVNVELNRFKKKTLQCYNCGNRFTKHEEKETDVAIAVRLIELLVEDRCDTAVVVSGDTDLAPAFRAARRLAPSKSVAFAFPYKRKNKQLEQMASQSFQMKKQQYAKHQFETPHVCADGTIVRRPSSW
jgi:uncharacterized LabA/DUF88 family protein